MKRIAIDRRAVRWRDGTGVARYRAGLADALTRLPVTVEPIDDGGDAAARPGWRDLPRILRGRPSARRDGAGWLIPDLYRLAQRRFTAIGALTTLTLPDPPAIVHWSHPMPIHVAGAANLYTVHDLIPLTDPQLTGIPQGRQRRLLERLAGIAPQFVTVSETVRGQLCAMFGLAKDRVSCCYQAVAPGEPGALPAGLASGGYLLAIGRVESRKNIEALLLAHRRADSGLPLVIAGPERHWRSMAERRRVAALLAAPDVIRLDWQDDATVTALIGGARALLMPSLAEGFGLPVVEAMALGVPALASVIGAAAEIAGDAALLVDPHDGAVLADAIRRIATDAPLRARLVAAGNDRAALFTPDSFAARLAALYERFLVSYEGLGGGCTMRVLIDGFNLALPHGTGVATYGFQLAGAIKGMGVPVGGLYGLRAPFNPNLRDVMFYDALGGEHETPTPGRLSLSWVREPTLMLRGRRARAISQDGRVISRQFSHRLPDFDGGLYTAPDIFDQARRNFARLGLFSNVHVAGPVDIMHWTYPLPVKLSGATNIQTMHDLVPLKLPYASADRKRYYYKLMRAVARRADRIVTVSESSRRDIIEFFPFAEHKIVNTYQAVRVPDAVLAESDDDVAAAIRSIFNLGFKDYFLFFGAIEPKKNVNRLIEAYLALATKTPLVIVGRRVWGADDELRLLQRDEVQPLKATFKNIRRIDYLPRALLMRLIRGAKAVTFPSIYEGFGLPVLEAMMLGTPVLTSNVSSLPEVGGDAALYVDPYDPRSIRAGLARLDSDAELRVTLSAAGRVQAERFSQARYQDRLARLYEELMDERAAAQFAATRAGRVEAHA